MASSPTGLSPINREANSLDSLNLSLSADELLQKPSRARFKGVSIAAPAVPVSGARRRDSPMNKQSRMTDEDSDAIEQDLRRGAFMPYSTIYRAEANLDERLLTPPDPPGVLDPQILTTSF